MRVRFGLCMSASYNFSIFCALTNFPIHPSNIGLQPRNRSCTIQTTTRTHWLAKLDISRRSKTTTLRNACIADFFVQVLSLLEGMDKVLAGGFSFIMLKNYILVKIASRYTDSYGQSLVYVSKDEFTVMSCYGWGVRSVLYNTSTSIVSHILF